MATTTTTVWQLSDLFSIENDFFRPQEKQQLQNAYEHFLHNTKCKTLNINENLFDKDNIQMLLQSKIRLFQLFIRTQPVNIRNFSLFHQHQQRIFIERLFYLVLNNVELAHFSTFNVNSIIHISKELERYQQITNKTIINTGKLNTIIQFVLSLSSSSITSFQLNNLFYLLLNDINDFSGKLIDRIAELVRTYHIITYGHSINKQYLITTITNAITIINNVNPMIYPLYENFLNSSYVYKGPLILISDENLTTISLYTIIQNLSLTLLGLTFNDFNRNQQYLSLTSEQCYHIRLVLRHWNFLLKQYHLTIEYPLKSIDKQIFIHLIDLILNDHQTSNSINDLLDRFMKYTCEFSEMKIKQFLGDLLIHSSLNMYKLETIRDFINFNRLEINSNEIIIDDCWLTNEQIRFLTHQFYSNIIYNEIILVLLKENLSDKRTINDLLNYFDEICQSEQVIDVQHMKTKFNLIP